MADAKYQVHFNLRERRLERKALDSVQSWSSSECMIYEGDPTSLYMARWA